MERAIKRGAGGEDNTAYDEVRYEGYGPGGIAVIVEALTDNRNRTASEVRTLFAKAGGNLGETNSVSFMFERKGRDRLSGEDRQGRGHRGRRDVRSRARSRRRQCRKQRGRPRGHLRGR